jgi:hypothetical protein
MAEVSKARLALDLEEIERQLRHSSQQPGSSKSDPLAELARIVGQDDPFRALLAGDKAPSRAGDMFARREPHFDDPGYREGPAAQGLRGSPEDDEAAPFQAYQQAALALTAEEEALLHGQHESRYSAAPHEAELYFQEAPGYAEPERTFATVAPRRSRKGLVAIGAVLGAAVLGTAAALTLRPGGLIGGVNGEPPVVKAETGPSKVAPENPGGVDIPNQNKQIYERGAQDAQTRVVNREEQPVDVRQATRTAGALADAAGGSAQVRMSPTIPSGVSGNAISSSLQGTSNAATGILGEPRRVRTVSIRPDGTMVAEQSAPSAGTVPASAAPMIIPRVDLQATPAPTTPALTTPGTASASPQPPQARVVPPQRPRDMTSTPVTARAGGSVNTNDTLIGGAPLQITPEAVRPKTDPRLAAAPQALLREPTETSAAPATSPGFSVQLAYRNTERDARVTFDQLQQRFAGELSGFSPSIRQAEINGKTAYRVRVGPMSRDDAAALCSRLKAAGGQCFVANN